MSVAVVLVIDHIIRKSYNFNQNIRIDFHLELVLEFGTFNTTRAERGKNG